MFVCMFDMLICLYVCMFVCLLVCLFACLYVCMLVCWYVCLIVRLFLCLYICMFVCLFLCLYVCMFMCLYVYYATPPRRFAFRAPNFQGFVNDDPTFGSSEVLFFYSTRHSFFADNRITCASVRNGTRTIMYNCHVSFLRMSKVKIYTENALLDVTNNGVNTALSCRLCPKNTSNVSLDHSTVTKEIILEIDGTFRFAEKDCFELVF